MSFLHHKHILVIENDASIRDALEMVLRDEHCIIHTCDMKNFSQVLDRWYPDIAIIDFPYSSFAPEIEKIIAILKQQAKNHVAILLMSTYKEIQLLAQEIGVNGFLEKPFDGQELLTKLRQLSSRMITVTESFGPKSATIDDLL